MKKYLYMILPVLLLAGCDKHREMDPEMLRSEQVGFKVKGKTIFTYEEGTGQLSYNEALKEFRAGNDDMSTCFLVRCQKLPTEEKQEIKADLKWKHGGAEQSRSGLTLRVEKIGEDGLVWLWSSSEQIGAVVRSL